MEGMGDARKEMRGRREGGYLRLCGEDIHSLGVDIIPTRDKAGRVGWSVRRHHERLLRVRREAVPKGR